MISIEFAQRASRRGLKGGRGLRNPPPPTTILPWGLRVDIAIEAVSIPRPDTRPAVVRGLITICKLYRHSAAKSSAELSASVARAAACTRGFSHFSPSDSLRFTAGVKPPLEGWNG